MDSESVLEESGVRIVYRGSLVSSYIYALRCMHTYDVYVCTRTTLCNTYACMVSATVLLWVMYTLHTYGT